MNTQQSELSVVTDIPREMERLLRLGEKEVGEMLSPGVRAYVVQVLVEWMKPGEQRMGCLKTPLALLVRSDSAAYVQFAGEAGILLASWFTEQAYRRTVSPTYFVGMAKNAYMRLASPLNGWEEVARSIPLIVAVLSESTWNQPSLLTVESMQGVHLHFARRMTYCLPERAFFMCGDQRRAA